MYKLSILFFIFTIGNSSAQHVSYEETASFLLRSTPGLTRIDSRDEDSIIETKFESISNDGRVVLVTTFKDRHDCSYSEVKYKFPLARSTREGNSSWVARLEVSPAVTGSGKNAFIKDSRYQNVIEKESKHLMECGGSIQTEKQYVSSFFVYLPNTNNLDRFIKAFKNLVETAPVSDSDPF